MDIYGKKAGKGPLVQTELSGTLGVSQDQYLFQPIGVDAYNQTLTGGGGYAESKRTTRCGLCRGLQERCTRLGSKRNAASQIWGGISLNMNNVICIEGNGARPSHQGDGYHTEGAMYTLNTIEQHAVCYGVCSMDSNAMKSPNPHSGFYEADTSRTLDMNGGNPACNQGGILVVEIEKSYGFKHLASAGAESIGFQEEVNPALAAESMESAD